MMKAKAAALTAALLAPKGAAIPAPFVRPNLPEPIDRNGGKWVSRARTRALANGMQRVKLSVRLDPTRHLKLKLTAAHMHDSVQSVLIDALDAYLDQISPALTDGRCTCLRRKGRAVEE